jgi:hypothetical protein
VAFSSEAGGCKAIGRNNIAFFRITILILHHLSIKNECLNLPSSLYSFCFTTEVMKKSKQYKVAVEVEPRKATPMATPGVAQGVGTNFLAGMEQQLENS